jgi:hypothetical protein
MIKTKSVYSAIEPGHDGLRVLVTRFRGRGLRKNRYHVWMPNLVLANTFCVKFNRENVPGSNLREITTLSCLRADHSTGAIGQSKIMARSLPCVFCRNWPNGTR